MCVCECVHLQAANDLLQWQDALRASDEGGGGQPEHLVQVRLVQTVEAYVSHDAPQHSRAVQGRASGWREKKQKEGGEDRLGGGMEWTPTEGHTIKTCRYESATNEWNEHLYSMEDTQSRESDRKGQSQVRAAPPHNFISSFSGQV